MIEDILIVRLKGVLTAAEQHLVAKLPSGKGRDLLKQVRSQLIEIARPTLEELVEGITGIKPASLDTHSFADGSTVLSEQEHQ